MKGRCKDVMKAVLMGLLMPYVLLNAVGWQMGTSDVTGPTIHTEAPQGPQINDTVWITVQKGDTLELMDLESYLVGVVLGEMPASFEREALKAQAVVARTYTLRRRETGNKHDIADVCTDSACCQAYKEPDTYEGTRESLEKVTAAVESTRALVLTYHGKLIEATYFSSSGGRTEDALTVWGSDLPYLKATDSPEEAYEDQYLRSVTFTVSAFRSALNRELAGSPRYWFDSITYTNGGGVDTMNICGKKYSGIELRTLLGLRSTAFTISATDDTITIDTRGHGHRVGMSQYGAEAMAVDGCTFDVILAHYYQGTVLEEYIDNLGDIG